MSLTELYHVDFLFLPLGQTWLSKRGRIRKIYQLSVLLNYSSINDQNSRLRKLSVILLK